LISGLPTYGAARRKMNLRIIGAIVGGLITVAAIIITTPNFETVLSYMLVSAAVLFISSYAGQGSENIAYAGKQIGTTYTLVFVGLSPATDITAPLWRTWGILLGSIIVGVVFLLLWPEYSGKSLLPRLRRALEIVVGLAPRTDLDAIDIRRRDAELANLLEELLSIAEDARMEGRASDLDPDAVIGAAGSLRRIAHRFARIGLLRLEHPRPPLDAVSETLEAGAINAMIGRLAAWQADFARPDCLERPTDASEQRADSEIGELLDRFSERLESNNFACLADWQSEARRTVLAELQSLRRLDFLIEELGRQLHRVRRAAAGPVI
jgi:uncharacterized membrane protein YccC